MATSSSILAWKIPWTEETGGLQFRESQSVRHDLATEHILKFIHLTIKQPSGFSVHGILQARILEWVAMLFSRGSS